jgi:membrane protease YdiL (CAAX protease family)
VPVADVRAPVTVQWALALTVVVMVAVNVWVDVGSDRWQPAVGPAVAGILLVVGRSAGLSWDQLGLGPGAVVRGLAWGGAALALVVAGYFAALCFPGTRRLLRDPRHRVGVRPAVVLALLTVPLGTVVVEEVAFRSVLWGLLVVERGVVTAAVVTSILFGLWHVLPARHGARVSATEESVPRGDLARRVVGTVAFTTLAGVLFAVLRHQSGSLLAPVLLHWATNGIGVLAAAVAWRWPAAASSPGPPSSPGPL